MNKKAQALLELSLFLGLMLMVLMGALIYQRNLYEQRTGDENVFEQAKERAYKHTFTEKDIDGEEWECSGAIVSYSLNVDRQANRMFQGGQRRTSASSASVYYSNAEDPEDLQFNYYNTTDISKGETEKKIYYDRPGGTEDPEDGLKLNAADWISILYPVVSSMAQGLFNVKDTGWWQSWGGWLDLALRAASYAYLTARFAEVVSSMDQSEAERQALEDQDEQMGYWGWRVCDEVHDGSALAGKKYVKDLTLQIYDISTEEQKTVNYNEAQTDKSSIRNVNVGHVVNRTILRRYDVTSPDPTIPLSSHTFEISGNTGTTVDLSGGQSEVWSY